MDKIQFLASLIANLEQIATSSNAATITIQNGQSTISADELDLNIVIGDINNDSRELVKMCRGYQKILLQFKIIEENRPVFQRVKNLELPMDQYALFGSAPMGIRGLKNCDHDIDIIVTKELWQLYKDQGWEVKKLDNGSEYLESNCIELYQDWKPGDWEIPQLISAAEIIDGLPFVQLATVAAWKELSGRDKDLEHLKIIQEFLQTK